MIDVAKMLADLKEEKEQLEQAILTLERLSEGRGPRRGKSDSSLYDGAPKRRGRPPGSKNKVAAPPATAPEAPVPEDTAVA